MELDVSTVRSHMMAHYQRIAQCFGKEHMLEDW